MNSHDVLAFFNNTELFFLDLNTNSSAIYKCENTRDIEQILNQDNQLLIINKISLILLFDLKKMRFDRSIDLGSIVFRASKIVLFSDKSVLVCYTNEEILIFANFKLKRRITGQKISIKHVAKINATTFGSIDIFNILKYDFVHSKQVDHYHSEIGIASYLKQLTNNTFAFRELNNTIVIYNTVLKKCQYVLEGREIVHYDPLTNDIISGGFNLLYANLNEKKASKIVFGSQNNNLVNLSDNRVLCSIQSLLFGIKQLIKEKTCS